VPTPEHYLHLKYPEAMTILRGFRMTSLPVDENLRLPTGALLVHMSRKWMVYGYKPDGSDLVIFRNLPKLQVDAEGQAKIHGHKLRWKQPHYHSFKAVRLAQCTHCWRLLDIAAGTNGNISINHAGWLDEPCTG